MEFASSDVTSFWIVDDGAKVGLVRLLDLADIGEGAPLFDLRIASQHRGRGVGTAATQWIVEHLFTNHPDLHRVEANTRHDNIAMKQILAKVGFTPEGRLREAWRDGEGQWFDTVIFGMLRTDWHGIEPRRAEV